MTTNGSMPTSPNFQDLTGQKFGRWTVSGFSHMTSASYWTCVCDCGIAATVNGGNLRAGKSTSCGCFRAEVLAVTKRTHGMSGQFGRTPEYDTWIEIRRRCNNPDNPDYGGRGIRVCERWNEYENFLADMGPRPKGRSISIERDDVNGNYEPGNCRWATSAEQARNKRNNHLVTFQGEMMCITDAIAKSGIPSWTVYERMNRGWSADRSLTEPVLSRRWRGPKSI